MDASSASGAFTTAPAVQGFVLGWLAMYFEDPAAGGGSGVDVPIDADVHRGGRELCCVPRTAGGPVTLKDPTVRRRSLDKGRLDLSVGSTGFAMVALMRVVRK